jgi:hypothetical protein
MLLIIALLLKKRKLLEQKKYKRKWFWVKKIFERREELGEFHSLVNELNLFDREYYFR